VASFQNKIHVNHIPRNRYELMFLAMTPITFYSISPIDEELEIVDLPDNTSASGGYTKPFEFKVRVPLHHDSDVLQMDTWWSLCQDPVMPTYKRDGTLLSHRLRKSVVAGQEVDLPRVHVISGAFIRRRRLSGHAMANRGDMAFVEYTLRCDNITSEMEAAKAAATAIFT